MKVLLLVLLLAVATAGQASRKTPLPTPSQPKAVTELAKLRDEFIETTKEYKTNLEKLLARYESNLKNSEDKLELAKKLRSEGLVAKSQIDEYELAIVTGRDKVTETRRQLAGADEQIAETIKQLPTDEELAKEYKQAKTVRRRSAEPTCTDWTLNASRRQHGRTVVVVFKLICKD